MTISEHYRTGYYIIFHFFFSVPENLIIMGVGAGSVIEQVPYWEQPFSQPYFDNSTRRETTTTVGQTAYLHCRVRNLGDRAVSINYFIC